ncbi:hypothetical protein CRYUN_Cryun32bG0046600 [Craigia yunnanensis]
MPSSCSSMVLKCWHLYQALISFAFVLSFGVQLAKYYNLTNIGAVSDFTSVVGKKEKTAMEIVVQNFNISLFLNPGRDPLISAITAEKPDKQMNMWEEGASVSPIGNHALAPVLSYAAFYTTNTITLCQPFLAKLTINDFEHSKCFAAIIHVYSWSRVIPISEEEAYVVFILEPSYTARVRSILTFQQLEQNITDIERLKKANSKIGFVGDSFVRTYFEGAVGFETQNIEYDSNKYKYEGQFRSINGAAAVHELDGKVFLSQHRKQFSEWMYFQPLSVWSFYLIYGAISTVCLLLFLIDLIRSYCCEQETEDNSPPSY